MSPVASRSIYSEFQLQLCRLIALWHLYKTFRTVFSAKNYLSNDHWLLLFNYSLWSVKSGAALNFGLYDEKKKRRVLNWWYANKTYFYLIELRFIWCLFIFIISIQKLWFFFLCFRIGSFDGLEIMNSWTNFNQIYYILRPKKKRKGHRKKEEKMKPRNLKENTSGLAL